MFHTLKECRDSAHMLESRTRERRPGTFYQEVLDLCQSGDIAAERISLRGMFEAFVGREALEGLNPRNQGGNLLMEAGDTIDTGAFSNIFGQITYSAVLARLDSPEFIADGLVSTEQAITQGPEIVTGVGMIGDRAEDVGEGVEYPEVGLNEEYITIPRKVKDGFMLSITEETVWEDNTGLVVQRMNAGAEALGITREKEILDTCLGITTSYSRNGGAQQATYATTHTQGTFSNTGSNTLDDYTAIEAALLLFDAITDPNTGEPVLLSGTLQIVVPTALEFTLAKILTATEIREVTQTKSTPVGGNPLSGGRRGYEMVTSQYVKNRTSSAAVWFIGDFKGAFGYREIWPITVERNDTKDIRRDIVSQVRVRRKGVPFVREPRKVVKNT